MVDAASAVGVGEGGVKQLKEFGEKVDDFGGSVVGARNHGRFSFFSWVLNGI